LRHSAFPGQPNDRGQQKNRIREWHGKGFSARRSVHISWEAVSTGGFQRRIFTLIKMINDYQKQGYTSALPSIRQTKRMEVQHENGKKI